MFCDDPVRINRPYGGDESYGTKLEGAQKLQNLKLISHSTRRQEVKPGTP